MKATECVQIVDESSKDNGNTCTLPTTAGQLSLVQKRCMRLQKLNDGTFNAAQRCHALCAVAAS